MNQAEVVHLLEEHGALLTGHFVLSSGRHSDRFVQKFRVLEQPEVARALGAAVAGLFGGYDVVAAPAVGAIILGFTTALAAGTRSIFSERVDGRMTFRRGFDIAPGERTLVVEDVITTGASAREVVELVAAAGGNVVGVGALIVRSDSGPEPELGAPLKALARLDVASWEPEECPLCQDRVPLDDPGSRRLGRQD